MIIVYLVTAWRNISAGLFAAVEHAIDAPRHLPAVLGALEIPAVGAEPVNAIAARQAMPGQLDRFGFAVRREHLQIGNRHRVVAVELDARQAGEMAQADGDRGLMLGRAHDGADILVAGRFLVAEIDLAVRHEGVAVISLGAGIGRRRMTGDQVIDREHVLDRAQSVFQRAVARRRIHDCLLLAPLPAQGRRLHGARTRGHHPAALLRRFGRTEIFGSRRAHRARVAIGPGQGHSERGKYQHNSGNDDGSFSRHGGPLFSI